MRRRAAIAAVLLAGCTGPLANLDRREEIAGATVRFAASQPDDAAQLERVLPRALERSGRWGPTPVPPTLWLASTHDALEAAVHRPGYAWLKAFARWSEIYIQAPSTWSPPGNDAEVSELLAHELTHLWLFQRAGTPKDQPGLGIPSWFREGMATVTADQAHRFPTLEDLARRITIERLDPFGDAQALERDESPLVYGAAHHAFAFLVRKVGDEGVKAIVRGLGEGQAFAVAFAITTRVSPDVFLDEFRRYLRMKGFRRPPKQLHRPVHPVSPAISG